MICFQSGNIINRFFFFCPSNRSFILLINVKNSFIQPQWPGIILFMCSYINLSCSYKLWCSMWPLLTVTVPIIPTVNTLQRQLTVFSVTLLDSDRWTAINPPLKKVNAKPVCSRGVAQVKLFILPLIEPFIKILLSCTSKCSYANKIRARSSFSLGGGGGRIDGRCSWCQTECELCF